MTTVINNPGQDESSGVGIIVGIIVLLIVGALFFVYVLPSIQGSGAQNPGVDVNLTMPTGSGNGGN